MGCQPTKGICIDEKSEKENEKEKVNGTSKTNGTVPNNPKTLKGDIFTKKNARREREKKMKAKRLKAVEEAQKISDRIMEEKERLSWATSRATSRATSQTSSPSTDKRRIPNSAISKPNKVEPCDVALNVQDEDSDSEKNNNTQCHISNEQSKNINIQDSIQEKTETTNEKTNDSNEQEVSKDVSFKVESPKKKKKKKGDGKKTKNKKQIESQKMVIEGKENTQIPNGLIAVESSNNDESSAAFEQSESEEMLHKENSEAHKIEDLVETVD